MANSRKLYLSVLIFICCFFSAVWQVAAQEIGSDQVQILSPASGSAVQGNVQIVIATDLEETRGGELSFTYAGEETETWFLIWESDQPIEPGELTVWDTSTLTDGNYDLRLVVKIPGGEHFAITRNLRVRNYSAIETSTPAPEPGLTSTATPTASPQPAVVAAATATVAPFPSANPASLSFSQVGRVLLYSAGGVFGIFLVIGMYAWLRSLLRSRR
jgi:hypothetical protein